jgi:hypothetical protein
MPCHNGKIELKLVAIYNVFDGEEFLEASIKQIRRHCDSVMAVVQRISNFGYHYEGGLQTCLSLHSKKLIDAIVEYKPDLSVPAIQNELTKRQLSVDLAKQGDFTHFLLIDCDEFYLPGQFARCKKAVEENGWIATVSPIQSYFKTPTLTIGLDCYYVPFIHQLNPDTRLHNVHYPFKVDPTRSVLLLDGSTVFGFIPDDLTMHHYTWVRRDIFRKVNNSSCRDYIFSQSGLLKDYQSATVGYHISHFGKTLMRCDDHFGLNMQLSMKA